MKYILVSVVRVLLHRFLVFLSKYKLISLIKRENSIYFCIHGPTQNIASDGTRLKQDGRAVSLLIR